MMVIKNSLQYPIRFQWIIQDENGNYVAAFQNKKDAESYIVNKK